MVAPNIALACASAGAVFVTVAFCLGIAFMTSTQFATAGIGCNPEILTNADAQVAAEAFCVDNDVVDENGAACQIANLGLFSAAYTPECSRTGGNPYALSALLAAEAGAPGDITVLFPSQTGFGSLPTALSFSGTVPEFTDCATFFAGTTGPLGTSIASQLTTNAAVGNLEVIMASFFANAKSGFDAGVVDFYYNTLEQNLFTDAASTLVLFLVNAITGGATAVNFDITTNFSASGASNGTWLNDIDQIVSAPLLAPLVPFAGVVRDMVEAGQIALPTENNAIVLAATGLALDRSESGIPTGGIWANMVGTILCDNIHGSSPCSGAQYLDGLFASLSLLSANDLQTLVVTAVGAKNDYRAGVDAAITALDLSTDALVTASLAIPDVAAAFSNAGLIAGIQSGVDPAAARGSPTGFPDFPFSPMAAENAAFALLCSGSDLSSFCTLSELINATLPSLVNDTDSLGDLLVVQIIVDTCAAALVNLTTCFEQTSFTSNPAFVSSTYRNIVMFTVFSSLYALEDATLVGGEAAMITGMIAACEDDVLNLAAITSLQTLAPVGTAFIGLGAVIAIVNLLLRNDKVKVVGIVAGVLCLIGTIIVVIGFLGLQGAPIYASLGGEAEDPLPDGNTTFALGGAFTIVLVFLGGAIVGSIVAIIGGALLSPKESSTDILGKA